MRITNKHLDDAINIVNWQSKRTYRVISQYGYKTIVVEEPNGGISNIATGLTTTEAFMILNAIDTYLWKERAHEQNV